MECRRLSRAELTRLTDIDWTETIESIYYMRDGVLVLEREHWDAPDWDPSRKQEQIGALQHDYDKGATTFGAFDSGTLVGMSVLQHRPLMSGDARLNLAGLWVSHRSRRSGVGRALCGLAAQEALALKDLDVKPA